MDQIIFPGFYIYVCNLYIYVYIYNSLIWSVCIFIVSHVLLSWDPMYCSLPGSSVHGVLQARILEWVAISFSRRSSRSRDQTWVSPITGRFFTIWAIVTHIINIYYEHSTIKRRKNIFSTKKLIELLWLNINFGAGFPGSQHREAYYDGCNMSAFNGKLKSP